MSRPDIGDVLDQLHSEGLLPGPVDAEALLSRMELTQPWYVRAMVGFGAWFASLMLISFIVGMSVAFDGGYLLIGGLLTVAGRTLRKSNESDFTTQVSLALGLSGQALFAFGVSKLLDHSVESEFLLVTIAVSGLMFWQFPDRTLRVLEVLFISSAATFLIYDLELNVLIPLIGPLLAGGMVYLQQTEGRWIVAGKRDLVRPAITGLMLSAFACLLLSTVYLLPELGVDFEFYPNPWISTALLGPLLLYLGHQLWPMLFVDNPTAVHTGQGLIVAVIATAWANPGLILALIVVIVGTRGGSRPWTGAGIGFLAVFTAMYFYGIEITLLVKSITLIATGTLILLARWLIAKLAVTENAHA
jgi:hypothetical protein